VAKAANEAPAGLTDDHWAPMWLRPVSSRPRLLAGVVTGLLVGFLTPASWRVSSQWILAWDVGVLVFLVLVFRAWTTAEPHHLRRRAALQDEGRNVMLLLALGGVIASVAAIVSQLSRAKGHEVVEESVQTAFGIGTVVLSWLFLQTFLAQHYAHEFYGAHCEKAGEERGGLMFPGDEEPGYWDFFHFAITIGATAQTADIQITSKPMRLMVTWHALMSYAFNTVVLALAISLLAGLFS
jgi:uncharacterized membrane protein